jgi:hypothetical protein
MVAELWYQGIEYANKKCQQAFTGNGLFSHKYKRRLLLQAGFWNHMAAKKAGQRVGSRLLSCFLINLNDTTPLQDHMALTATEVDAKAKAQHIVYRKYKKSKPLSPEQHG